MNNEIKQILKNQLTIISTMSTMNPEEICKKNLENSFNETQELLNPKNQKEIGEKTNESMGGRYGEEPTMNPDKKSKGCGKVTYSHGIPMPKCGTYPKGKNFIYLCEECCTKDDALKEEPVL